MTLLEKQLTEFRDANGVRGKGQLAVVLHITRLAIENAGQTHLKKVYKLEV